MKKVILSILVVTAFSAVSLASTIDPVDVGNKALNLLMTQNPMADSDSDGDDMLVNSLIARGMLTTESGTELYLAQVTNACELVVPSASGLDVYSCRLFLVNSDRVVEADGSITPAKGMTESAIIIDYTFIVDPINGTEKIYDVKYLFAG